MRTQKDSSSANVWRKLRERAGLTQREVSEALGYTTPQFVSNVERGRCRFPVEKLSKLKKLYRVSNDQIVDLVMLDEKRGFARHFKKLGRV
ncbi:MAG: helix-turn-helix domain-containing protein [Bdellovibrionales bacterium]